jgi:hypothetical protein
MWLADGCFNAKLRFDTSKQAIQDRSICAELINHFIVYFGDLPGNLEFEPGFSIRLQAKWRKGQSSLMHKAQQRNFFDLGPSYVHASQTRQTTCFERQRSRDLIVKRSNLTVLDQKTRSIFSQFDQSADARAGAHGEPETAFQR